MSDLPRGHLDPKVIHQKVLSLIDAGKKLQDSCKQIGKEIGKSWLAVKRTFYRQGGSKSKAHGNSKLTKLQENILLSIIIVYSILHDPISKPEIRHEIKNLWKIDVSQTWSKNFVQRYKDELVQKKTKILALKRTGDVIVNSVAKFVADIDTF